MVRVSPVSLGGVVVRQSVPPVVETSELEDNTELHCSLLSASTEPRLPTVRVMSVVMLIEDSTLPGFIEVDQTRNTSQDWIIK